MVTLGEGYLTTVTTYYLRSRTFKRQCFQGRQYGSPSSHLFFCSIGVFLNIANIVRFYVLSLMGRPSFSSTLTGLSAHAPRSIAFEHFFVLHPEMNYKQTSNDNTPYLPKNELEYLKQDLSSFTCFLCRVNTEKRLKRKYFCVIKCKWLKNISQ